MRYLNDPASGLSSEYHSAAGGTWHDYLFAEGKRVGQRIKPSGSAASWQAYVPDHLGSVAVVTDGSGTVLQRLAYDAWGLRRNPNGTDDTGGTLTASTSRGFTGHEHVASVGLIDMNARMYDPELGRFLSPDSYIPELFNSESLNRYSYVYNNPLAYTDPTGHAPLEDAILVGGSLPLSPIEKLIITSALHILFSLMGDDDEMPPPLLHQPGLASVNEDMQASPRLHDVSQNAGFQSMEAGWSMWGGYKYNQLSEYALSHTQADAQGPVRFGTIEPIEGRPILGLFKFLIREATLGVVLGDTGSVIAFRPSIQTEADIESYLETTSQSERFAMGVFSPSKVSGLGNVVREAAKAQFRREAAGQTLNVIRDRSTGRIVGVGSGRGGSTYRPKSDGSYSVGPAGQVRHYRSDGNGGFTVNNR